jgi:hypothetical protein
MPDQQKSTDHVRLRYGFSARSTSCFNALKGSRAVSTRYDKRAYVFHGPVILAAIRLWRRS